MGKIFDFSDIEKSENAIHKTWGEFRDCLAKGLFTYEEIDRAKEQTFLKTYDDLFRQHSGIEHKTTTIKDIKCQILGRGTKSKADETPNHDRFFCLKKNTLKRITDLALLALSGYTWLLEMKMIFTNALQLNVEQKMGTDLAFAIFNLTLGMMIANW